MQNRSWTPRSCEGSPNGCRGGKRPCSTQHVAEWLGRSAPWQKSTISPSKSPRIWSTSSRVKDARQRSSPQGQVVDIKLVILRISGQSTWRNCSQMPFRSGRTPAANVPGAFRVLTRRPHHLCLCPQWRATAPLSLWLRWLAWLRSFASFGRRSTRRSAAREIFVGSCKYLRFSKRIWMIGQLFAQRSNLLGCHRAGVVSPLTALICQDIGNFLVGQCFIPRLHHGGTKLLAFHFNRTCQTFENNHRRTT